MEVWKLSQGKDFWFFTRRDLAIKSIQTSYSGMPSVGFVDQDENNYIVQWIPEEGGQTDVWFHLELIIDNREVLDRVEHL